MNYYWANDRRSFITNANNSTEFDLIPIDIKIDLVVNYLYGDVFMHVWESPKLVKNMPGQRCT